MRRERAEWLLRTLLHSGPNGQAIRAREDARVNQMGQRQARLRSASLAFARVSRRRATSSSLAGGPPQGLVHRLLDPPRPELGPRRSSASSSMSTRCLAMRSAY